MPDRPVTGTREWAAHSANVVTGCAHGCLYCYAHSLAQRYGRVGPGGWTSEVYGGNDLGRRPRQVQGTVMFPTTHDLTPANLGVTLPALRGLLEAGNHVLVVSKPHLAVIERITDELAEHRNRALFRFTIGTARDKTLAFFEPGAPPFDERMAALRLAHARGWRVSVSMEPLLEPDEDRVVGLVELLADSGAEEVWIGKLNRARPTMAANGCWNDRVAAAVRVIEQSQSDERIRSLGARLAGHPAVRWKESFKVVLGVELRTDAGEGEAWAGQHVASTT
jgi:DNA repair photolyase